VGARGSEERRLRWQRHGGSGEMVVEEVVEEEREEEVRLK